MKTFLAVLVVLTAIDLTSGKVFSAAITGIAAMVIAARMGWAAGYAAE